MKSLGIIFFSILVAISAHASSNSVLLCNVTCWNCETPFLHVVTGGNLENKAFNHQFLFEKQSYEIQGRLTRLAGQTKASLSCSFTEDPVKSDSPFTQFGTWVAPNSPSSIIGDVTLFNQPPGTLLSISCSVLINTTIEDLENNSAYDPLVVKKNLFEP